MIVRLQKISPTDDGLEIQVDHYPFVIGRRSESDCSLPLACISRRHCQLTQEGEQILVQDLESYNGTFVNGRRALTPLALQHGDELSLGPILFRVLMQNGVQETQESGVGLTKGDHSLLTLQNTAQPADSGPAEV